MFWVWYNFIKTIMANNNNIIIPIFHGAQLEQFLRFSTVMFLGPKSGAQGRRSTEKKKKDRLSHNESSEKVDVVFLDRQHCFFFGRPQVGPSWPNVYVLIFELKQMKEFVPTRFSWYLLQLCLTYAQTLSNRY